MSVRQLVGIVALGIFLVIVLLWVFGSGMLRYNYTLFLLHNGGWTAGLVVFWFLLTLVWVIMGDSRIWMKILSGVGLLILAAVLLIVAVVPAFLTTIRTTASANIEGRNIRAVVFNLSSIDTIYTHLLVLDCNPLMCQTLENTRWGGGTTAPEARARGQSIEIIQGDTDIEFVVDGEVRATLPLESF